MPWPMLLREIVLTQTQTRENIAMFFLLCLVCLSAYLLFWRSQFFEANSNQEKAIAKLINSKNSVKHRAANELVWRDVTNDADLRRSDQIFTYENSSADVKFNSGAQLSIGPTALVKIELQNNDAVLNLTRGMLYGVGSANSSGAVKIKSGESQIMLDGKDARFQIAAGEDGKGEKIAVFGSAAKVVIGGKTYTLNKNQVVGRDSSGKVKVDAIEIEPIEPKANQSINWSPEQNIRFAWQSEKYKNFDVLIATDMNFKKIVSQKSVNEALGANVKLASAGSYYWKVRSKTNSESLPQHFTLVQIAAPWPVLPAGDKQFVTPNGEPLEDVRFTWESDVASDLYEINVATDINFKKIIRSQKNLAVKNFKVASLSTNNYFWRVRQRVGQAWSAWSETQFFSVLQPKLIPVAIAPINGAKIKFETTPKPIAFSWSKPTFATEYKFYIFADATGEKVVTEKNVTGESIQEIVYKPGKYYWKVVAFDVKGEKTGESKLESFLRDNPPSLAPPKIDSEFKFKLKKRQSNE